VLLDIGETLSGTPAGAGPLNMEWRSIKLRKDPAVRCAVRRPDPIEVGVRLRTIGARLV